MAAADISNHSSGFLCTIHLSWTSQWCSPIACNPRTDAYISWCLPENETQCIISHRDWRSWCFDFGYFRLINFAIKKNGRTSIETHLKLRAICWLVACLKTVVQIECFFEYFVQFSIDRRTFLCWFGHCLLRRLADWLMPKYTKAKERLFEKRMCQIFKVDYMRRLSTHAHVPNIPHTGILPFIPNVKIYRIGFEWGK